MLILSSNYARFTSKTDLREKIILNVELFNDPDGTNKHSNLKFIFMALNTSQKGENKK